MLDDLQLDQITDPQGRELIQRLLNLIETLSAEQDRLKAENQQLRDEISRLKGTPGRPKGPLGSPPAHDVSSEAERRVPRGRIRQPKNAQIQIDREEPCRVDPSSLPHDAQRKGTVAVIVQDLALRTDNVRFLKEKWYSPSTGQTYLGVLPVGYEGQFGPNLKSLVWLLANVGQMSQPKILEVVRAAGIHISSGHLGHLLLQQPGLDAEASAIAEASLRATPWQQVDHTATRVKGDEQQCHILTTPVATVAHTQPSKDRLATLDSLRNNRPRRFRFNADAEALLLARGLSAGVRRNLIHLPWDVELDEPTLTGLLDLHVGNAGPTQRQWIVEALALAAYRAATDEPVIRLLVSDDAPQLGGICAEQALCWVHDGRHYKKLRPRVALHYELLRGFLKDYWAFYHELRVYQEAPSASEAARLQARFDELFATETGYDALDDRIAKTRAKRSELLQVLTHPELPLHNNAAELGCRARVRRRDVSFGPRTEAGKRAWDVGLTLVATARKLGVNIYRYIQDRLSGRKELPSLADLIVQRAQELNLGASWAIP
ncbi:MAG: hypothetical protein ACK4XJ_12595 [Fimbriimonadaceae bacterium]